MTSHFSMNRSYNEEGRLCQFPSSVPSIESCLPLAGSCATGNSKNNKKNTAWCGGTHVNLAPRGSTQDRFQGQWDLPLNPFLFPFSFSHLSSLFPRSAMWSSLTSSSPCILIGKGLPGIASLSSEIRCVPWHTCLQRYFHEYVPE